MANILMLEDCPMMRALMMRILKGHNILAASTLSEASSILVKHTPDLAIIDLHLPDGNAIEFLGDLRRKWRNDSYPLIILTGDASEESTLDAIRMGADEYMTKPINANIFLAKINRWLSKVGQDSRSKVFKVGNYIFDEDRFKVKFFSGSTEQVFSFSTVEFKLLAFLAKRSGQIVSREEILDRVWGADKAINDRVIDQHVNSIRRHLGSLRCCIQTVYGAGYQFNYEATNPKI